MKQYVQTDSEVGRQVASTLAELIIGGSLTSFEITRSAREGPGHDSRRACPRDSVNEREVYKASLQTTCRRPFLCSRKGLWPW